MKHKVAELEGGRLDLAVQMTFGPLTGPASVAAMQALYGRDAPITLFQPSTNWAHGGPIIERERICVSPWEGRCWAAWAVTSSFDADPTATGPTPLIAAMRAFVAAKMGDEVELP